MDDKKNNNVSLLVYKLIKYIEKLSPEEQKKAIDFLTGDNIEDINYEEDIDNIILKSILRTSLSEIEYEQKRSTCE